MDADSTLSPLRSSSDPERLKAGTFTINGVSLAPTANTIEHGKKIVAFRTEKTVAAIKKAMAER